MSEIDVGRLQVHFRRLAREELLTILDRAVELLPPDSLLTVLPRVKPDSLVPRPLLESVAEFREASLRREYFDSFEVNYKNSNQTSRGTDTWFAECRRLLGQCVQTTHQEGRQGFDSLFELLRKVDRGDLDIVFFADEGGSYLLGVNWNDLLPAYFCCLAATATAHQYAEQVVGVIEDFVHYQSDHFLALAMAVGTGEQQQALSEVAFRSSG